MPAAPGPAKVSHSLEGRTPFVPSPVDVLVVRTMLRKSAGLPFEITNRIIEFAEYWTCSHTSITYEKLATFGKDSNKLLVCSSPLRCGPPLANRGNQIRAPPVGFRRPPTEKYTTDDNIPPEGPSSESEAQDFEKYLGRFTPSLVHPVRKIVFTFESRDQGWGGDRDQGEYHGSWTWFEAGLERFDTEASCKYSAGHSRPTLPLKALHCQFYGER